MKKINSRLVLKSLFLGLIAFLIIFQAAETHRKAEGTLLYTAGLMDRVDEDLNSDRSMYRYDFGRTSNFDNGPQHPPMTLDWEFHTYVDYAYSVVVASGKIYLACKETIYCFDADSYEEIWHYHIDDELDDRFLSLAGIAVASSDAGSYLYFGTNGAANPGYRGKVVALDADNGELQWIYETDGYIRTSPAVYKGIVYIGSSDRYLYALDAVSGDFKWKKDVDGAIREGQFPTIANDMIYINGSNSYLRALDPESGEEIWVSTFYPDWAGFIYHDDTIFSAEFDDAVVAVDPFTGEIFDRYDISGYIASNLCSYAEKIYFVEFFGSFNQQVVALNKDTLEPEFVVALPYEESNANHIFVSNNLLYVGRKDKFHILNATSGELLSDLLVEGYPERTGQFLYDGKLYVAMGQNWPATLYVYKYQGDGQGCFLEGTPITMGNGSTKPIEKIKVGDIVLSYDEKSGEMKPDTVTEVFSHPKEDDYLIINDTLKVTPIHPVLSKGEWRPIGELKVGDTLTNTKGEDVPISDIAKVKETIDVYNFEVNPTHTYVAGGFIVHNRKLLSEMAPRGGENPD